MAGERYGLKDVMVALDAAVESDPARIDEAARDLGGRYARHGKPCCLVGDVLIRMGFKVGTLKDLDRDEKQIDESRHPLWRRFSPAARQMLAAAQRMNDGGSQWGQIRWGLYRIDAYWKNQNHPRAYPGPWCTDENGHVASWHECPKF